MIILYLPNWQRVQKKKKSLIKNNFYNKRHWVPESLSPQYRSSMFHISSTSILLPPTYATAFAWEVLETSKNELFHHRPHLPISPLKRRALFASCSNQPWTWTAASPVYSPVTPAMTFPPKCRQGKSMESLLFNEWERFRFLPIIVPCRSITQL